MGSRRSQPFGIIDMQGRSIGFSGENNGFAALHMGGRVGPNIYDLCPENWTTDNENFSRRSCKG